MPSEIDCPGKETQIFQVCARSSDEASEKAVADGIRESHKCAAGCDLQVVITPSEPGEACLLNLQTGEMGRQYAVTVTWYCIRKGVAKKAPAKKVLPKKAAVKKGAAKKAGVRRAGRTVRRGT